MVGGLFLGIQQNKGGGIGTRSSSGFSAKVDLLCNGEQSQQLKEAKQDGHHGQRTDEAEWLCATLELPDRDVSTARDTAQPEIQTRRPGCCL